MSGDPALHNPSRGSECSGFRSQIDRREMLTQCASGFGAVAFSALLGQELGSSLEAAPLGGVEPPLAKARSVIDPRSDAELWLLTGGGTPPPGAEGRRLTGGGTPPEED